MKNILFILVIILLISTLGCVTNVEGLDSTVSQVNSKFIIKDGNTELTRGYTYDVPDINKTCISTYHSHAIWCYDH